MGHDPADLGFDPDRLQRVADFARAFVDDGRLVGTDVLVARHGQVVLRSTAGLADREQAVPVAENSLWRIFSMTKPITSVAVMQLVEEGRLRLRDPLSRFIPAFAEPRVLVGGTADDPETVPAERPITIADLLNHTAGIGYSIQNRGPVDELHRRAGLDALGHGGTLVDRIERLAAIPLLHQPGTRWSYSMATDVLGRVVEVIEGRSLGEVLEARILEPLGMVDTVFRVDDERLPRMTSCYQFVPGAEPGLAEAGAASGFRSRSWESGGGGLVSTMADYHRFCAALIGGGELDGHRILGSRTVRQMMVNHLPGGGDLDEVGDPLYTPGFFSGCGFGLGFATVEDPARGRIQATRGEASWGGAATTAFWVDPVEGVHCVFLTQLLPSSVHVSLRWDLRTLVNQALVD
jgi:CubicO group peptidase (beta-lactamase class C family)